MRGGYPVSVIIPTLNEAQSIGHVLEAIPDWVDEVIVADNGSTDETASIAKRLGARVVREDRRGYGSACLRGMRALRHQGIVVFLDGDFSDHPEQIDRVVDPIVREEVEIVIGSRTLGKADRGALTPQAMFGNWLACFLIRIIWGARFTDLGPFRAIRHDTLERLAMTDPGYGWTVEMQLKAVMLGIPYTEAPVDYRRRIGRSKISGTIQGVAGAGFKILSLIAAAAVRHAQGRFPDTATPDHVIVFTRYPEPGKAKTRLTPVLGEDGAAETHRAMTEHVLAAALDTPGNVTVTVRFAGGNRDLMKEWLGVIERFAPQGDGDLGERMGRAFRQTLAAPGAERAVIIGTDCPGVTGRLLRVALDLLHEADVVLGPATDGGYYLIGLRQTAVDRAVPQMFQGIAWGTSAVFDKTMDRIRAQGLRVRCLAPLEDVDRPEDLPVWQRAARGASRPPISVIIPALNEAERLPAAIARANSHGKVEIIVVDGGSSDGTPDVAAAHGARVHASPPGRARQMNLGAAKAGGEVLLFLHADTLLPENYADHVGRALSQTAAVGGAFRLQLDDGSPLLRFLTGVANWRARWLGFPYGDQALFLPRRRFHEMGGFRELPIMEDFDLVQRLRRLGRIVVVDAAVVTSARRWQRLGPWRTTILNQMAVLAWQAGMSADRIARFHGRKSAINTQRGVNRQIRRD